MRVKRILTVLFVIALLLTGCAPDKSGGHSLHLFYPAANYEAGGDVLCSRTVDWSKQGSGDTADQVKMMVQLLQNRDGRMNFTSPIPPRMQSCWSAACPAA